MLFSNDIYLARAEIDGCRKLLRRRFVADPLCSKLRKCYLARRRDAKVKESMEPPRLPSLAIACKKILGIFNTHD